MVSLPMAGGGTAGTGTNQVGAGGRRAEVRGSSEVTAAVAGPLVLGPVKRGLFRREPAVRRAAMPRPVIRARARAVWPGISGPRRVAAVLAVPALAVTGVAVLEGVVAGAAIAQIAVAVIAVAGRRIPGPRIAGPSIA